MRTTMRLHNLLKFFLALAASNAFAGMPVVNLNPAKCATHKASNVGDFHDLIEEVNLPLVDNRGPMSMFFREIAAHEQNAMNRIQGTTVCISADGLRREANGTLVEDGGQLMTNVHVFADRNEKIHLDKLPSCTFTSMSNPGNELKLVLREGNFKFGTLDPENDPANDYAFVRLNKAVADIDALNFDEPPEPNEPIFLVTAKGRKAKVAMDPSQLVVRQCFGKNSYAPDAKMNSTFLSTCAETAGDSAGIYYARRKGLWKAVGLHQGGGNKSADGLDVDITNPDPKKRSFAMGLGFDEKMLKESKDLAKRATEQANARGDRKVNSVSKDRT